MFNADCNWFGTYYVEREKKTLYEQIFWTTLLWNQMFSVPLWQVYKTHIVYFKIKSSNLNHRSFFPIVFVEHTGLDQKNLILYLIVLYWDVLHINHKKTITITTTMWHYFDKYFLLSYYGYKKHILVCWSIGRSLCFSLCCLPSIDS